MDKIGERYEWEEGYGMVKNTKGTWVKYKDVATFKEEPASITKGCTGLPPRRPPKLQVRVGRCSSNCWLEDYAEDNFDY